jgi:hypothetical protein
MSRPCPTRSAPGRRHAAARLEPSVQSLIDPDGGWSQIKDCQFFPRLFPRRADIPRTGRRSASTSLNCLPVTMHRLRPQEPQLRIPLLRRPSNASDESNDECAPSPLCRRARNATPAPQDARKFNRRFGKRPIAAAMPIPVLAANRGEREERQREDHALGVPLPLPLSAASHSEPRDRC